MTDDAFEAALRAAGWELIERGVWMLHKTDSEALETELRAIYDAGVAWGRENAADD